MDSRESLTGSKIFSSHLRRQASLATAEFEAAMIGLSAGGDEFQLERVRAAAEELMKLSARVLIELE